jgi:hypothetical protein
MCAADGGRHRAWASGVALGRANLQGRTAGHDIEGHPFRRPGRGQSDRRQAASRMVMHRRVGRERPVLPHVARCRPGSIHPHLCKYCRMFEEDRSSARIELADLVRLTELADDAGAELLGRNPSGSGRNRSRLLGRALCQDTPCTMSISATGSRTSRCGRFTPSAITGRSCLDGGHHEFFGHSFGRSVGHLARDAGGASIFSGRHFRKCPALIPADAMGRCFASYRTRRLSIWQRRPSPRSIPTGAPENSPSLP